MRALSPHIGARADLDGQPVTLWKARVSVTPAVSVPGTASAAGTESLQIACGEGAVEVLELQPAGKRRMTVGEYLRGLRTPPARAT